MNFLNGIAALLFYQLLGTLIVLLAGITIPGPVLGMFLLFLTLLLIRRIPEPVAYTSNNLLTHLSLLFVPAGVGVVSHLQRIGSEWLPIITTLFVSTLISMAVTAWVMQWAISLMHKKVDNE